MNNLSSEYKYSSAGPSWSNQYLWPVIRDIVAVRLSRGARILDLGCGSGATATMLSEYGFSVTGVDPSATAIQVAVEAYPNITFAQRSAYDDLSSEFGTFDAVVSLEVVEHCYWPRQFANAVYSLLRPGGFALISTPFHSYLKNLALALAGRYDHHWSPLWDGGHIKFFSERTLRALLQEAGFVDVHFKRAGRIHVLAKSMVAVATRSANQTL